MKTRAQIYEREAAALLRDISMYHVMTEKQLLLLHPGKDQEPFDLSRPSEPGLAGGRFLLRCSEQHGRHGPGPAGRCLGADGLHRPGGVPFGR